MSKSKKNFDETLNNLNGLVESVQAVLHSKSKAKSDKTDENGNVVYVDLDIYDKEMLETFVYLSLSNFNQVPYFTFYTMEDTDVINLFNEVLVEGAVLYALASQALIERGREFQITDTGLNFDPPNVSELLNTQYSTLLQHHFEKLTLIKREIQSLKFPKKKK